MSIAISGASGLVGSALAAAFEAVLSEHAAAGWEYVRTDLAPMEARRGLLGGVTEAKHVDVSLMQSAAAQLLEGSMDKAIEEIDGALREPSVYADVDRLKSARELLAQIRLSSGPVVNTIQRIVGFVMIEIQLGGKQDFMADELPGAEYARGYHVLGFPHRNT